ncbi:transposase [Sinorhizobium meliloti]|uniref:transposase n=1 Tax=Rhizobium meliloti TaxID=382 RepID=UPI00398C861A
MIEAVPERLEGSPRQLRRFWSDDFKAFAVEEASRPGANISAVARQIGILPSQLFRWRRELVEKVSKALLWRKNSSRDLRQLGNALWRSSLAMPSYLPVRTSRRRTCSG